MSKQYIKNQKELLESINKNIHDKNKIIQYYLIFDENDEPIGAIGFRYALSLASSNPQLSWLILSLGFLALLSPFIYFSFFPILSVKDLVSKLKNPLII